MRKLLLCTCACMMAISIIAQKNVNTEISLNIAQEKNTVLLTWTTSLKDKGGFFTLERSTDGENFKILKGTIATSQQKYELYDFSPYVKTYYRVKQTDALGSVTYSPIKLLKLKGLYSTQTLANSSKE